MKKKSIKRTKKSKTRVHPILAKWYKYFGWGKPPHMVIKDYSNVELASTTKTDKLEPYINKVVAALGHKEALVTDKSYVSDFLTINLPKFVAIRAKELAKAKRKLKISFTENELVTVVAMRLRKNEK